MPWNTSKVRQTGPQTISARTFHATGSSRPSSRSGAAASSSRASSTASTNNPRRPQSASSARGIERASTPSGVAPAAAHHRSVASLRYQHEQEFTTLSGQQGDAPQQRYYEPLCDDNLLSFFQRPTVKRQLRDAAVREALDARSGNPWHETIKYIQGAKATRADTPMERVFRERRKRILLGDSRDPLEYVKSIVEQNGGEEATLRGITPRPPSQAAEGSAAAHHHQRPSSSAANLQAEQPEDDDIPNDDEDDESDGYDETANIPVSPKTPVPPAARADESRRQPQPPPRRPHSASRPQHRSSSSLQTASQRAQTSTPTSGRRTHNNQQQPISFADDYATAMPRRRSERQEPPPLMLVRSAIDDDDSMEVDGKKKTKKKKKKHPLKKGQKSSITKTGSTSTGPLRATRSTRVYVDAAAPTATAPRSKHTSSRTPTPSDADRRHVTFAASPQRATSTVPASNLSDDSSPQRHKQRPKKKKNTSSTHHRDPLPTAVLDEDEEEATITIDDLLLDRLDVLHDEQEKEDYAALGMGEDDLSPQQERKGSATRKKKQAGVEYPHAYGYVATGEGTIAFPTGRQYRAATTIQAWFIGCVVRRELRHHQDAAIVIQRFYRDVLRRRCCVMASWILQRAGRGWRGRSKLVQSSQQRKILTQEKAKRTVEGRASLHAHCDLVDNYQQCAALLLREPKSRHILRMEEDNDVQDIFVQECVRHEELIRAQLVAGSAAYEEHLATSMPIVARLISEMKTTKTIENLERQQVEMDEVKLRHTMHLKSEQEEVEVIEEPISRLENMFLCTDDVLRILDEMYESIAIRILPQNELLERESLLRCKLNEELCYDQALLRQKYALVSLELKEVADRAMLVAIATSERTNRITNAMPLELRVRYEQIIADVDAQFERQQRPGGAVEDEHRRVTAQLNDEETATRSQIEAEFLNKKKQIVIDDAKHSALAFEEQRQRRAIVQSWHFDLDVIAMKAQQAHDLLLTTPPAGATATEVVVTVAAGAAASSTGDEPISITATSSSASASATTNDASFSIADSLSAAPLAKAAPAKTVVEPPAKETTDAVEPIPAASQSATGDDSTDVATATEASTEDSAAPSFHITGEDGASPLLSSLQNPQAAETTLSGAAAPPPPPAPVEPSSASEDASFSVADSVSLAPMEAAPVKQPVVVQQEKDQVIPIEPSASAAPTATEASSSLVTDSAPASFHIAGENDPTPLPSPLTPLECAPDDAASRKTVRVEPTSSSQQPPPQDTPMVIPELVIDRGSSSSVSSSSVDATTAATTEDVVDNDAKSKPHGAALPTVPEAPSDSTTLPHEEAPPPQESVSSFQFNPNADDDSLALGLSTPLLTSAKEDGSGHQQGLMKVASDQGENNSFHIEDDDEDVSSSSSDGSPPPTTRAADQKTILEAQPRVDVAAYDDDNETVTSINTDTTADDDSSFHVAGEDESAAASPTRPRLVPRPPPKVRRRPQQAGDQGRRPPEPPAPLTDLLDHESTNQQQSGLSAPPTNTNNNADDDDCSFQIDDDSVAVESINDGNDEVRQEEQKEEVESTTSSAPDALMRRRSQEQIAATARWVSSIRDSFVKPKPDPKVSSPNSVANDPQTAATTPAKIGDQQPTAEQRATVASAVNAMSKNASPTTRDGSPVFAKEVIARRLSSIREQEKRHQKQLADRQQDIMLREQQKLITSQNHHRTRITSQYKTETNSLLRQVPAEIRHRYTHAMAEVELHERQMRNLGILESTYDHGATSIIKDEKSAFGMIVNEALSMSLQFCDTIVMLGMDAAQEVTGAEAAGYHQQHQ